MSTIEITLPDELREAVDEQVASGRFANQSEYVRELIERDQNKSRIESKLVERMGEDGEVAMDSADVAHMRESFLRGRT